MLTNSKQIFDQRLSHFSDQDYIPVTGILQEKKLLGVNHICIHSDCTIFNDLVLPFGAKDIEDKTTAVIDEILHNIIHLIQDSVNRNKKIIICGDTLAKRMLGRKLEDRLKRKVEY